jgi:hypothetical protein
LEKGLTARYSRKNHDEQSMPKVEWAVVRRYANNGAGKYISTRPHGYSLLQPTGRYREERELRENVENKERQKVIATEESIAERRELPTTGEWKVKGQSHSPPSGPE